MRIINLKKYGKESILKYDQLSSFRGVNSFENPILIKPSEILPPHLKISKSLLHVHLDECSFDTLVLRRCHNIKIIDCTCEILHLDNCSNIDIEGCQITTTLFVRKCSQVKINNCSAIILRLIRSHENYIEDCSFEEAISDFSSGNIFNGIQIPEKSVEYLLKNKLFKKIFFPIQVIVLLILLSSFISLWRRDKIVTLWISSIFTFVLLITSVSIFFLYREMRKYPPNEIINEKS